MKVITNSLVRDSKEASPFDLLMTEILGMRNDVIGEAKSAEEASADRKAAKEKKTKKAAKRASASKERGDLDTEKAEKAAGSGHDKQIDTSQFKNTESFASTPEDAHLHTDGKCDDSSLRHNKSAQSYAKHGDLEKNPCDKSYPKFSGKKEKARTAGALRQAYARHDDKAIKSLEATARAQGMEPKGASWDERPQCSQYQKSIDPKTGKGDTSKLPPGWVAKDCKPHGQGGGDEWLRGHHSDSSQAERHKEAPGETRHKSSVNRLKALRASLAGGGEKAIASIGPRKRQGHDTHTAQEKHKDVHHVPLARHRKFQGAGKVYHAKHAKAGQLVMPNTHSITKSHTRAGDKTEPTKRSFMMGNWNPDTKKPGEGGRGGELARGARRTLSKKEQAKRKAPNFGERGERTRVVRQGADWHKLSKDKTGKRTSFRRSEPGQESPKHKLRRSANRLKVLRSRASQGQPVGQA